MIFQRMRRFAGLLGACAVALTVAACGGSGAGAGGGGMAGGSEAAQITVTTSSPTLASNGTGSVTITAVVKNALNQTLANQPIVFSTTDAGAQLAVNAATTDTSGSATAVLSITDRSNRGVPVSVTSGTLTSTVTVNVVGTSVSISGPSSIVAGAATEYVVTVRDSGGEPIRTASVVATSAVGNPISPATIVTDAAGQAKLLLTGANSGADTLRVSALGAMAEQAVNVSGTQITFSVPAVGAEIDVGAAQPVTVTFVRDGAPVVGETVLLSATRGTLAATSVVTDGTGTATTSISSPSAGVSTVSAAVGGVVSSRRIEFVSRTPGKLSLRAGSANVAVNIDPNGTSSSQLIAVVRDVNDNPVKGQQVFFNAVSDPSNGRIEPGIAITDSSGVASVAFFPGANPTGNNQIVVRASVPGTALSQPTTLTASAQALFVRAGTGNEITKANATTNEMPWTARVTDSSGVAVSGATVQASVVGIRYFKGKYTLFGDAWTRTDGTGAGAPYACVSEDTNGNGRLDAGEDLDGDGKLEPVGIPSVIVTTPGGRTDASGEAAVAVRYEREYGGWVEVRLRVTMTTIAGTEGVDERTFILPVLGNDLTNKDIPPPGHPSPFGQISDCTVPD